MEVKVSVNGIQRVVCGVTEETTCQEVVLALAQSLGQSGRYTLREKFKDFERCLTPDERLLETLERYSEQAKEVQLSLQHNGPSTAEEMARVKVGRYQPCPPLRRKDVGPKMRRSSGSLSLHRQSLPPLSCLREEAEEKKDNLKTPKRKSLSLVEEAWEWLESLGKGKVYSTACDKQSKKRTDKRGRASLDLSLFVTKENQEQSCRGADTSQKSLRSDLDHQTSCCIGSPTKEKNKCSKKGRELKSDQSSSICAAVTRDEKNRLRDSIICQLLCLQDLQVQIANTDTQIFDLEQKQKAKKAEEEAQERLAEEEMEHIRFWENELKAEESYEKELQHQFLQLKAKAVDCKATLEEYKRRMQGFDFFANLNIAQEDTEAAGEKDAVKMAASLKKEENLEGCDSSVDGNVNRKFLPKEDHLTPHALVPPNQIKERRPTGPTELREWWKRWSAAQKTQSLEERKVIHRSELTVYLRSTKV
ncbi:ras association domain-containing protein 8 [Cyprinodon tularosa]|uniref:ras association domain-containing protein 8 n=1 Tax=Cyprinodon tularosa TaxID=77115 RepID=UPI0018E2222B|nr:ras association domain-containing protein 8 [Cyprinodon tularosa]XP_038145801.1 ras association domain-containing protein 8 [Cyprinodon tularosa]